MSCLNPDDLHRIFRKLDKNGDGLITIEQLNWLLEKIGCATTLEDLQHIGSPASLDSIDFFFFYDYFVNIKNLDRDKDKDKDKDLAEAFKVFDLNGDGFISRDELRTVLLRFGLWDGGDGDCESMIRMYDTNSDGLLDFEEFKRMMIMTTSGCSTAGSS